MFSLTSVLVAAALATTTQAAPNPYLRKNANGWSAKGDPYAYDQVLGQSIKFFEVQRSGKLSKSPGGYRIDWKKDQLLFDGYDTEYGAGSLAGGHYEAGNRLKISLASGYAMARLAFSCLYWADTYNAVQFEGKSMMYWCKREVQWGADWLAKTHLSKKPKAKWQSGDQFVVQVGWLQNPWGGPYPGDFDCYRRAENIPGEDHPPDAGNCKKPTRRSILADSQHPASDSAAEASAGLAMSAALLAADKPQRAKKYWRTALALYDFAMTHPGTMVKKGTPNYNWRVATTYGTHAEQTNRLWASAVLAFVTRCDKTKSKATQFCSRGASGGYEQNAWKLWSDPTTYEQKTQNKVANWNNAVYDSMFLMGIVTGNEMFAKELRFYYLQLYLDAHTGKGNGIGHSPLGMRTSGSNQWASLRLATVSAWLAMAYGDMPGANKKFAKRLTCYTRSQLGYILGDTGRSYVVGVGKNYPTRVHHRDAACRLTEDAMGLCDRPKGYHDEPKLFVSKRPNPHEVTGAIVGGPTRYDYWVDDRKQYHYTEVAIDFNCALTMAVVSAMSGPKDLFKGDCSKAVPFYPKDKLKPVK